MEQYLAAIDKKSIFIKEILVGSAYFGPFFGFQEAAIFIPASDTNVGLRQSYFQGGNTHIAAGIFPGFFF